MIVYKGRMLKKWSSQWTQCCSVQGFQISHIICNWFPVWLQILIVIVTDRFKIMPDIVSKLLCTIWSRCAVLLESEQAPFSETESRFRDCSRLGNTLCLCSPVQPAQVVPERYPKSSAIDFAVKAAMVFWNSLWEWLSHDQEGLELGLKLELCLLSMGL